MNDKNKYDVAEARNEETIGLLWTILRCWQTIYERVLLALWTNNNLQDTLLERNETKRSLYHPRLYLCISTLYSKQLCDITYDIVYFDLKSLLTLWNLTFDAIVTKCNLLSVKKALIKMLSTNRLSKSWFNKGASLTFFILSMM